MNEYNNLKTGTEEARRSEKVTESIHIEGDSNQEVSLREGESTHVVSQKTKHQDYPSYINEDNYNQVSSYQ